MSDTDIQDITPDGILDVIKESKYVSLSKVKTKDNQLIYELTIIVKDESILIDISEKEFSLLIDLIIVSMNELNEDDKIYIKLEKYLERLLDKKIEFELIFNIIANIKKVKIPT